MEAGALEAGAEVELALVCFLLCFFGFCVAVLLSVALLSVAVPDGCWAANANGRLATANAVASNVFFIPFFSLAGLLPAHSLMFEHPGRKLDSLPRLTAPPKLGAYRVKVF